MKPTGEQVNCVQAKGNIIKDQLPTLIDEIKRKNTDKPGDAHICFSTAHKSKGLEFSQVRLTDDYVKFFDFKGNLLPRSEISDDEINLLYVACTRAKERLQINPQLEMLIGRLSGRKAS